MTNKKSNKISTAKPSESTKKPKAPDWLLENIAEASKNARKIYFLYVGILGYCALTVVTTTDRQIILNDTVRLPFVNLNVWLSGFFIIAPLMAIFVFVYLQLYLSRLNRLITDLRANYAPIKKGRLYPWMINFAEDPDEGFIGKLQILIVKFSLWWLLPIVLALFPLWFVKKHVPVFSYIVGTLPILGTSIVLLFWCHYEGIQDKFKISQISKFIRSNSGKIVLAFVMLIYEASLFFYIIPYAKDIETFCVDLSYQVLINEPEKDYVGIYWLDLNGAHLEGANLTSTILKRADFRGAHLQRANMSNANLQEADLSRANLQGAELLDTNLQGAYLGVAILQEADLSFANLQGADLPNANLQGADLSFAILQGFDLGVANLQGADLGDANLQEADLSVANLQKADLRRAKLQGANLWNADLQGTNLSYANLQEAYLERANLQEAGLNGANLQGADLQDAEGLTVEQLSEVKTLYKAILDPHIMEEIKKKYPHLLKKPEEENIK